MTGESRRRLAALLVGAGAMLTALLVATLILQDRCQDAGGRWLAVTRRCELPAGSADSPGSGWAWLAGLAAGLAAAVVMWRSYVFFVARAQRRAGDRR